MNARQFPLLQPSMQRRLDSELEPVRAGSKGGIDAPRFDWLLLSFWVGYCAVYVGTAWTVLRWATMPVGA